MKTLIKVFYWILGIIAIIVIVSYFLPKSYKIERSVSVKAGPDIIYGLISNFHLWHLWAPWTKEEDTTAIFTITGPAGQVGTSWGWTAEKYGNGEMALTELTPGQLVAYDLAFDQGKYTSKGRFEIENKGDSCLVYWVDEGDLGYNPISRYMGLFMEKMMGPDFEKGLAKLKNVAEQRAGWPRIEETVIPEQVALLIRDSAGPATYGQVMGRAYGEIMGVIESKKYTCTGAPFAIYLKWDSVTMNSVMDLGIPAEKAVVGKGRVRVEKLPSQAVVVAHYFGPYDKTASVYYILEQYIRESGKQVAGAPWEIYITDPMTEKDTSKWATDIAFPVK